MYNTQEFGNEFYLPEGLKYQCNAKSWMPHSMPVLTYDVNHIQCENISKPGQYLQEETYPISLKTAASKPDITTVNRKSINTLLPNILPLTEGISPTTKYKDVLQLSQSTSVQNRTCDSNLKVITNTNTANSDSASSDNEKNQQVVSLMSPNSNLSSHYEEYENVKTSSKAVSAKSSILRNNKNIQVCNIWGYDNVSAVPTVKNAGQSYHQNILPFVAKCNESIQTDYPDFAESSNFDIPSYSSDDCSVDSTLVQNQNSLRDQKAWVYDSAPLLNDNYDVGEWVYDSAPILTNDNYEMCQYLEKPFVYVRKGSPGLYTYEPSLLRQRVGAAKSELRKLTNILDNIKKDMKLPTRTGNRQVRKSMYDHPRFQGLQKNTRYS